MPARLLSRESIVLQAAKVLDHNQFRVVHRIGRWLEFYLLGPLAFHTLLVLQPRAATFRFRNSILFSDDFHLLWSDLDSDLIVKSHGFSIERFTKNYRWMKLVFWFLGEVEIFHQDERQRLDQLYDENNGVYRFIRLIRKLSWMRSNAESNLHPYHIEKAKRSMHQSQRKILNILNIQTEEFNKTMALKKWISLNFANELTEISKTDDLKFQRASSYQSSYWEMSFDQDFDLSEIALLLAIVPDGLDYHPEMRPIADSVRRRLPRLKSIWRQNVEIELLHLNAWTKFQHTRPNWIDSWKGRLQGWLD